MKFFSREVNTRPSPLAKILCNIRLRFEWKRKAERTPLSASRRFDYPTRGTPRPSENNRRGQPFESYGASVSKISKTRRAHSRAERAACKSLNADGVSLIGRHTRSEVTQVGSRVATRGPKFTNTSQARSNSTKTK